MSGPDNLHLMAPTLLSPQMVLSLFHALEILLQFMIPILEQLLLSSRQLVMAIGAAFPLIVGL